MRVFILYPPISKMERYGSEVGNAGGNQIPLGIFYLGSYLRSLGHKVRVADAESQNLTTDDIVARIKDFKPDLMGISSTTVAFHRTVETAKAVKAEFPDLPIVLGGPHVSSNTAHAMSCQEIDYGVVGEGEETLRDLVLALEEGGPLEEIPGLSFRQEGEWVLNSPRPMIPDLDSLPLPAYDLIPNITVYSPPPTNYKKSPVANIITGRGCPNLCTFCDKTTFGSRLRQRSAENVAEEIELLYQEYGVREIAFVDDTFTYGKKRIYRLFEILKEKDIFIYWTCMSRINTVDYDLLKYMKDNGCWHISFGIESGSPEILKIIKKDISLEDAETVIGWCKELKIRTKGFFMIGHPGETEESLNMTIRTALSLPLDDIVASINTPIPGSPQYDMVPDYGELDTTDWTKFNGWRPVFVPFGLSQERLLAKHRELYRRFYLRPRVLWRYGLSFFSPTGLKRFSVLCRALPFLFKRQKAA